MITINAKNIELTVPDKTPLLSYLRNELSLSGPKLGCGEGECGACMVLVDGRPQTSCNLPLWAMPCLMHWKFVFAICPCPKITSFRR